MSCFTDIENKPDDWLVLDPLTIQKPIPKTGCDTNLIVQNYLSEFKTDAQKQKVKDNLGLYVDNIISSKSTNPVANKTIYQELNKLRGHIGLNQIKWVSDSNMNNFVIAGVYDINGERTNIDDNLPILNANPGHSFNAKLTVLDSSITGSGKDDDKCITQVISFSNRIGQGEVYIRTGKGASLDDLSWEEWSTLQRNINVGQVDSLDDFKDNGIYSGVWLKGQYNSYPRTFVCVVINDYFIGIGPRRISQFVYGLSKFDGSVVYQSRVWDDSKDKWSDWEILNQKEISSMISDEIKKVTDGIDPEKIDSIKDIVAWIDAHGGDVSAIYNAIQGNTIKINEEIQRAQSAEGQLQLNIEEEAVARMVAVDDIKGKAALFGTFAPRADAEGVLIRYENIKHDEGVFSIPAATTENAGVMSAEDKKKLNAPVTTDRIQDGAVTAQKLSAEVKEKVENPLRPLYIAAGAEYDKNTGFYSLNGVNNLTESDIAVCYNYKDVAYSLNMPRILSSSKIRTIYPVRHPSLGQSYKDNLAINGLYTFESSKIEFFRLSNYSNIDTTNTTLIPKCVTMYGMFYRCSSLHTVYPLDVEKVPSFIDTFVNCVSLKTLRLFKLSKDLSLSDSPLVDKASALYMINNASPTHPITITLHADAYARLANDADIVAALEAQPLVTLVSA